MKIQLMRQALWGKPETFRSVFFRKCDFYRLFKVEPGQDIFAAGLFVIDVVISVEGDRFLERIIMRCTVGALG
ncbi:MAG: hypothetical protein ACLP05_01620 [Candidatus Kryptoniota bacterium]